GRGHLGRARRLGHPAGLEPAARCGVDAEQHRTRAPARAAQGPTAGPGGGARPGEDTTARWGRAVVAPLILLRQRASARVPRANWRASSASHHWLDGVAAQSLWLNGSGE